MKGLDDGCGARGRGSLGTAIAAFAVAGLWCVACDSPVGPPKAIQYVPSGPQLSVSSGSGQLYVYGTNEINDGDVTIPDVITYNKYDAVYVKVSGQVTTSDAGFCDPPVGEFGNWGPWGSLQGQTYVTVWYAPGYALNTLNDSAYGGSVREFGKVMSGDSTITITRDGSSGSCGAGPGVAFSGSQSIEYSWGRAADVHASDIVISSGDTVTFTGSSNWSYTSINGWRFVYDDTTSTPAGSSYLNSLPCSNSTTCDFWPARSGRAYWGIRLFEDDAWIPGPIVWVGTAPAFDLSASGTSGTALDSITRGDSVKFTASNIGMGGELSGVDITWRFEPDSVQYYDNSVSPWFMPDTVTPAVQGDTVWEGMIVHPGKVIVRGERGVEADEDTITVTVGSRSWAGAPEMVFVPGAINTNRPPNPAPTDTIWDGARFHEVADSGLGNFQGYKDTGYLQDGGPNRGYYYVKVATFRMVRSYSLNPWIDPPGVASYDGSLSTTDYVTDRGHDVADFRNKAIAHEIADTADSHKHREEVAVASPLACANINAFLERLVLSDPQDWAQALSEGTARANDALDYLASHLYVNGFQGSPNHVAEWRQGLRPDVYDGATGVTSYDGSAPDPNFCVVSGV